MKKLIAQFWFTSIIAFLLAVQLVWVLLVATGVNHITTRLLFPVLFVAGIVIHFRTK